MKQYTYADYDEYLKIQKTVTQRKILGRYSWARKETIQVIAAYLKEHIQPIHFGICHGTRRGFEQAWFKEFLGVDVLGTDISLEASKFPNTIQWDFHETKPEWLGAVDFIYSNALDHSFDPIGCLANWISCLTPSGLCILEWSQGHDQETVSSLDPFGASLEEYKEMAKAHYLVDVLEAPIKHRGKTNKLIFIGQKAYCKKG